MSSVATSPAAPTLPRASHARRPSTLTVYRWELRKLRSQKRTYLGFGLAVLFPLIFVIFENLHQRHGHGGNLSIFSEQITASGLATPVLTLEFLERLRGERRFESAEALIEQMHRDVERTREIAAA